MYVFYDFETTGTSPAFDQPLQFAAILTDNDLNEKEAVNIRCNIADHILPSPIALALTKVTPKQLHSQKLNYYGFSREIASIIQRWTPATWTGYNSLSFDENILRQMFYQHLEANIYKTQFDGNARLDIMKAVQACWGFGTSALSIPTAPNGKLTMKLEHLAQANGFDQHHAHDALGDVRATIHIMRLIQLKSPEIWNQIAFNMRREALMKKLQAGDVFYLVERFGAAPPKIYTGCYCGAHVENNKRIGFFDLSLGMTDKLADGDEDEVLKAVSKSPLRIRTVDVGAMPLLFPASNVSEELTALATKIVGNGKLLGAVGKSLALKYSDKAKPTFVEQRIYDGFYQSSDKKLLHTFHSTDWEKRHSLLKGFQDDRLQEMGSRLCVLYSPSYTPADVRSQFWATIKGRWEGSIAYGDDENNPGNTYASIQDDLGKLADGKSFPVTEKEISELSEYFRTRKL